MWAKEDKIYKRNNKMCQHQNKQKLEKNVSKNKISFIYLCTTINLKKL